MISGLLSDEPESPKAAPKPKPPLTTEDEDVKLAQEAQRRRLLAAKKGRAGTLLAGNPLAGHKSLLGE